MESQILNINTKVEDYLKPRLEGDFGVNVKAFDIGTLEIDKDSPYYKDLRHLTAGNTGKTMDAQTDTNIQQMKDTQRITAANMEESLRIQREEMQRAQRLQTETNFMGAHSFDKQMEVLKAGAQSMGGGSLGGGGGSNPAGMMAGMMMGGAMGQQMAGMMSNLGQQMQGAMNTPPPMPNVQYHISVNGAQSGPFTIPQLTQMVQNGQINAQTYVWKQGMANWELAGNVQELAALFMTSGSMPPPPPPPVM